MKRKLGSTCNLHVVQNLQLWNRGPALLDEIIKSYERLRSLSLGPEFYKELNFFLGKRDEYYAIIIEESPELKRIGQLLLNDCDDEEVKEKLRQTLPKFDNMEKALEHGIPSLFGIGYYITMERLTKSKTGLENFLKDTGIAKRLSRDSL